MKAKKADTRVRYDIIPVPIQEAKDITPVAKLLYCKMLSLSRQKGYCYASQSFLAQLTGVSLRTVGNAISLLKQREYICTVQTYAFYRRGLAKSVLHVYPLKHLRAWFDGWGFNDAQRTKFYWMAVEQLEAQKSVALAAASDCENAIRVLMQFIELEDCGVDMSK